MVREDKPVPPVAARYFQPLIQSLPFGFYDLDNVRVGTRFGFANGGEAAGDRASADFHM